MASADLPVAAQLRPGDRVRFRFVSVEEAQDAFRKMMRDMNTAIEEKAENQL